jgi:hypothetical protein
MSKRIFTSLFVLLFAVSAHTQGVLFVDGADTPVFNPIELIEDVCLGPGIDVLEINFQGDPAAVGRFTGGENFFGIEEGFVMTTGIASSNTGGIGVDNLGSVTASEGNDSPVGFYEELEELANSTDMYDVAEYEIRFIPTGDTIAFRYVFASEEYPQYVCTNFNDVFAFFLDGPTMDGNQDTRNLALIPGTDLPVSINSVNAGIPGSYPTANLAFCSEAANGSLDYSDLFNFNFINTYPVHNGYTNIFEAKAAVIPCQEYTMRLVIADFGDDLWDSAIFFEAESFCSYPGDDAAVVAEDYPLLLEACAPPVVEIDISGFPPSEYPLTYTVSGTAQLGVDYFGLEPFGTIDLPTPIWPLFLPILDEGIDEPIETISINIKGVDCLEEDITLRIADRARIVGPDTIVCSSEFVTFTLDADPEVLEEFDFEWSSGDTTTSISVSASEAELITLLYANEIGFCTDLFELEISDPEGELNLELCTNDDGVVINGTLYNFDNPSGTEVLAGAAEGGCDSILNIRVFPEVLVNFAPELCDNETIVVNGTTYSRNNPTGLEVISGGAANGCDSVLRVSVVSLIRPSGLLRMDICEDEEIVVNGTVYGANNPDGQEIFAGAGANGCDSILNIALEILPNTGSQLNVTIEEGEAYDFAGESIEATGEYPFTFAAANGCDSIVLVAVRVNTVSSTIRDTIILGQAREQCVNTDIFQDVASFENSCPGLNDGLSLALDVASACVEYTGEELGVDTVCLLACDNFDVCDTTYLIVSTFENLLDAVDDYDTTLYDEAINLEVLANDWTSATVIDTQYLVVQPSYGDAVLNSDGTITYTPVLNACQIEDEFSYAICNDIGCDTATVFIYLDENQGLCDGVWPGDVNNDGIVNQIDHWAVGLAYGQNGPVRPNASFDWVAQPAIDWNGTITFIYEFNLKYADCNGTGQINTDDVGPIYVNWGLTHPLSPEYEFPNKAIPVDISPVADNGMLSYHIALGDATNVLIDAYGLAFELHFPPRSISWMSFDTEGSVLGQVGDNLMLLEKMDVDAGVAYISLVRNDHQAINDYGFIGQLSVDCFEECEVLQVRNIRFLKADGSIFDIPGNYDLDAGLVSGSPEQMQQDIQLFPNPAKAQLNIYSSEFGQYQLINRDGSQVETGQLQRGWNQLDVARLPAGLYLFRTILGGELVVKKLIVE